MEALDVLIIILCFLGSCQILSNLSGFFVFFHKLYHRTQQKSKYPATSVAGQLIDESTLINEASTITSNLPNIHPPIPSSSASSVAYTEAPVTNVPVGITTVPDDFGNTRHNTHLRHVPDVFITMPTASSLRTDVYHFSRECAADRGAINIKKLRICDCCKNDAGW